MVAKYCSKKDKKQPIWRAGFTLIELLVVISIIAVLLSVLMPALSKAKRQAQAIVCSSKMKTIGTTIKLYQQDYRGYFPPAWMPKSIINGQPNNPVNDWLANTHMVKLLAYKIVPSEGAYLCPSHKPLPEESAKPRDIGTKGIQGRYTYIYNLRFGGWQVYWQNPTYRMRKDIEVKQPSRLTMFAEAPSWYFPGNWYWFEYPKDFQFYHNDATNLLFADTHVERQKKWNTYDLTKFEWLLNPDERK